MENITPLKSITTISDLLEMVHLTIIKENGSNYIILKELEAIDKKIKSGKLKNYNVNTPLYWTCVHHDIKSNYPNVKFNGKENS